MSARLLSRLWRSSLHSSKKVTLSCSSPDMKKSRLFQPLTLLRRNFTQHIDQSARIERLDDETSRAELARALLLLVVALGGQHQDRQIVVFGAFAHVLDDAVAVELGHVDVGDDDVDRLAAE